MSQQPAKLDYAVPQTQRGAWVWWVLAVLLAALIAAVLLFLVRTSIRYTAVPAAITVRLTLPQSKLTIVQRTSQAIPGSNNSLVARISDITGGQTLLTIDDAGGNPVLNTVSVKKGDINPFNFDGSKYEIELVALKNLLAGDDFAVFEVRAAGDALSEEQKIERLLFAVAGSQGVVFIRNGEEHAPDAAAAHLRRKYDAARKKHALTARDFIEHVASRSSISGESYRVRHKDGRQQAAQEWFTELLAGIESSSPATQPGGRN